MQISFSARQMINEALQPYDAFWASLTPRDADFFFAGLGVAGCLWLALAVAWRLLRD